MKRLIVFILFSTSAFSQCPCVYSAVIGTDLEAVVHYNNKVEVMDDIAIKSGESIQLYTKNNSGELSWYSRGKRLVQTLVSPTESTAYTVKSSLIGCPDAFDMVIITVEQVVSDRFLSVFPNPTNRFITVVSGANSIKKVLVYNLSARKVLEYVFDEQHKQQLIDLNNLSAGVYMMDVVFDDGGRALKRIIKY